MSYKYVVIGAGRQGVAIAYALARNCEAQRVGLVELDPGAAARAVDRLALLLPQTRCELAAAVCDISQPAAAAQATRGADVVISAVPYKLNVALTDAAIAAGASFCDLGGNTNVVHQQLARDEQAHRAGVSIAPDCGLAPGLGNILAAHGVQHLDSPQHVHVRCGGLPETPVGPLGYQLAFHIDGLINEYSGCGEFLRGGRPVEIPALTELEELEFPPPVGRCEAAVTSGGTSTCAESFAGRLETYDYKTVRYPGHFAIMRALFELGCFEERLTLRDGTTIEPKALLRRLLDERLHYPGVRDVVVLRCTVTGQHTDRHTGQHVSQHAGQPRTLEYELLDRFDQSTGFTAMERTTGFPAALVAYMQARRLIEPGARPLESCVPTDQYLAELPAHDIRVAQRDVRESPPRDNYRPTA